MSTRPFAALSRRRAERRAAREVRAVVADYTAAVRATLPAFDSVESGTLVDLGTALLVVAATGSTLERLRDVFAMGSEFVDTADLAGLAALAHAHLGPVLFDAE
ncbi:hypothetical protein [Cellulosimicrobium sp. TH-20]|uniref:hypothetical protein n=1 Tax=Cellulosimicrobium sp. TH-20 TaxID=1980001 RepID=UPI0011A8A7C4|nr:hypothetical protein [Cellulosimicrobium sp. TH-20]